MIPPITVLGYVAAPGEVTLRRNRTVEMAVAAAGGLVSGAQLDRIQLRREGIPRVFDYKRYLDAGDRALLLALPARGSIFDPQEVEGVRGGARSVHVISAVTRPGSYETSGDVTTLDVLAAAGEPRDEADIANIRIVSSDEGGMASAVSFDLGAFLERGGAPEKLPAISHGRARSAWST